MKSRSTTSSASPRIVELFAGAGGMALGFRAVGCRIVAAAETNEAAAATFRQNFDLLQPVSPPVVRGGDAGDVKQIDFAELAAPGDVDILIGGPPCQGFSRVGRGKLDSLSEQGFAGDPRNILYRRFLEAATFWGPKAVVMENVPGMLGVAGRDVAAEAAAELADRGYRTVYTLLNAAWYGVPQLRQRLFFIGIRDDLGRMPGVPAATHRATLPAGYERRNAYDLPLPFVRHFEITPDLEAAAVDATTVRQALGDLPPLIDHLPQGGSARAGVRTDVDCPGGRHSLYAALMREWPGLPPATSITHHTIRKTPRDWVTFGRMRPGDRYAEALRIARARLDEKIRSLGEEALPASVEDFRTLAARFVPPYSEAGFADKWRKLFPDRPSWTVPAHLAKDSYSHIHYDSTQARAISVREAARLQSFPDAFTFVGNMGDRYRQIGNAVPPLLAWAVGKQVLSDLGCPATPLPWSAAADPLGLTAQVGA